MLTAPELSAEIHVPVKTLAQWRYLGMGPSYLKLGGHVRYRRSDVDAWLDGCRHDAAS
ncbi:helix-turn-helix transcriptional regulator [Actinomarinicola tropica]|uniref:Helix-turn-helix domain-containing protein n=1 Tax=Actinomarinicola tropica TaxID=2789776 RepID=A0A5Q2RJV9_9ACTN|nr:helix-turn-helix domain-containing protein [Actinomarinicola tropica]QGG97088.1 helix-turn-helix domain-containing protein [Actinomarinicola tropica]